MSAEPGVRYGATPTEQNTSYSGNMHVGGAWPTTANAVE